MQLAACGLQLASCSLQVVACTCIDEMMRCTDALELASSPSSHAHCSSPSTSPPCAAPTPTIADSARTAPATLPAFGSRAQPPTDGTAAAADDALGPLQGKRGVTLSPLRPSGFARIEGRKVDVVTRGEMIDEGVEVSVIDVSGNRVVVAQVKS